MSSKDRAGIRVEGQKMEVLGRLTSAVIHDLNNLLTVIGLNAALIEGGELSPEDVISAAEKISEASRHSAELTRKVLNFARKSRAESEPMQPDEVVEGLLRMLSPLIARRVAVRVNPGCGAWIHGDRSAIELAVMNLVLNAADAMPGGGEIVITTSLREAPEGLRGCAPGTYAQISVADAGEGIDPSIGDSIFEPFFTTKAHGTGMGLSIVSHVASTHGGTVEFDSRPGEGSEFRLLVPVAAPPDAVDCDRIPGTPQMARRRGTALLVEDDGAIRGLTRRLLERQFERVLDAPTAEDALEVWTSERGGIDLLLTDLMLPGEMSGRALALRLLEENSNLPVLYMSGYGSSWDDRSFLTESNFLAKPFPPDALERAVSGVLPAG